jgi:molecular chaperone DnaK
MRHVTKKAGVAIGIDLGTTRSGAAYVDAHGHASCLPNRDGQLLTPSCVGVAEDGRVLVGASAQSFLAQSPDRAIEAFKRHMGDPDWRWTVDGRTRTADDIAAILLGRLLEDAEGVVGSVAGAVITVPAYFGDPQRAATLRAAAAANLPVLDIINEPTAAAIASAFDAYVAAGGDAADATRAAIAATAPAVNVICDLGGGTFDVTVIRIDGTDFDVLASDGCRLGGRDFDEIIVEAMYRHLFDCDAPDPHHDPRAQARMRLRAEQAKHVLTVQGVAPVDPPYDGFLALDLTRERFENMSERLVDRAREVIAGVMRDAELTWPEVEDVLLVGGASRMPMFRRMVEQVCGKRPNTRLQPDLIIAQGAAVYAAILRVQDTPLLQAAGSELADLDDAIEPAPKTNEPAFAPDFTAAAVRVHLREVAPRSLGVVVRSPRESRKINRVLIPRNHELPATRSHVFATRFDNQRKVVVPIVEGEQKDPAGCTEVGRCVIDPLPPDLPKGSRVEVSFSYDRSGLIHVRAEELTTKTGAETTLQRASAADRTHLDDLAEAVARFASE